MKKINVAIIGAGKIAEEHIKAFKATKRVNIVGIYSRTFYKASMLAKKYNITFVSSNIKDLYYLSKADLLIIAVSVISTKKVCIEALKFNWKILCEKPIGCNYDEFKEILLSSKNINNLYVALNRVHFSSTKNILSNLKKIKSKRIIHLFDQEQPNFLNNKLPSKIKNNWLYANSIHILDFCRIYARGKIVKISKLFFYKNKIKKFFIFQILFTSGDVVLYHLAWNIPGPWSVQIFCDANYFEMKPLEKASQKSLINNKLNQNFNLDINDQIFKPGFKTQAEEMLKIILKKKSQVPNIKDIVFTKQLIRKICKKF